MWGLLRYIKMDISMNPVLDALGAFLKIEYNINIMLLLWRSKQLLWGQEKPIRQSIFLWMRPVYFYEWDQNTLRLFFSNLKQPQSRSGIAIWFYEHQQSLITNRPANSTRAGPRVSPASPWAKATPPGGTQKGKKKIYTIH